MPHHSAALARISVLNLICSFSGRGWPALFSDARFFMQDAVKFPIIGSIVLISLFIMFKLLPKDLVNMVLTLYFVALGAWVIAATIFPFINVLFPPSLQEGFYEYKGLRIPLVVPVRINSGLQSLQVLHKSCFNPKHLALLASRREALAKEKH